MAAIETWISRRVGGWWWRGVISDGLGDIEEGFRGEGEGEEDKDKQQDLYRNKRHIQNLLWRMRQLYHPSTCIDVWKLCEQNHAYFLEKEIFSAMTS